MAALLGGCLVCGCGARSGTDDAASDARRTPDAAARSSPTAEAVRPATRATSQVLPQRPVALTLPSGTRVRVRPVGTARDGRLAVPPDVHTAGWWRGGSRIGDPFGAVLVAGHVDSRTQGLGAYAELLESRPGQRIEVRTAGLVQRFRVRSLRLVRQESLAEQPWMHSPRGPVRLVLVTCAPPYDRARGGYQNLAVVTAEPLGRPRSRTGGGR